MIDVLTSEWTKFRSVRSTYWTLFVAVVTPIALSAFVAYALTSAASSGPPVDPMLPGLLSLEYAVLAVSVLGVLAFSTEYSTGLIQTTFAAVPRRLAGARGQGGRHRHGHARRRRGGRLRLVLRRSGGAVRSSSGRVPVPPRCAGGGAGRGHPAVRVCPARRGPRRDHPAHRGRDRRGGRRDRLAVDPGPAAWPRGRASADSPCWRPLTR